ncbi:MAG TPA: PEGA domain-containing protein [Tepidisphaeraceae bacterium]|nr:PEGA domain-containing protein [Tepidisphaeraceae bacterium]
MIKSRIARGILTGAVSVSMIVSTGCSAFQPPKQAVLINTPTPGAEISVDGNPVGRSPVSVELDRNKQHAIIARYGEKTGTANVGTKISGTGILDIIGTFIFIIPAIGIFTPGFHELESTNVAVPLN